MPKVTLSESAVSDNAIEADATRTYLEFSPSAECRWCFGATFAAGDSQRLPGGDARIFQGELAAGAFSFGKSRACVVDATFLTP